MTKSTQQLIRIPLVDLRSQHEEIKDELKSAIRRTFESSSFIMGEEVKGFQKEFATLFGAKKAVAVSSGTTAIHLALHALGVGREEEVITTPFTFIGTTEPITQTGAKPVFVDIHPDTCTIDTARVEQAITSKTRAILPVHLFGQSCDMDPLMAIAKKHKLLVVEDCAQAHLSEYRGRIVGTIGDAGCFSFFPGKNLGACGDAGAILTQDEKLGERMEMLSNHGRKEKYSHEEEGFNYRMDGLQAAILRVKLKRLAAWTEARRERARRYDEKLRGLDIVCPVENSYGKHAYHLYVIRSPRRDQIARALSDQGIATGVQYPIPLHLQPAYRHLGHKRGDFPVSEKAAEEVLSLPLYPQLSLAQVDEIAEAVKKAL